MWGWHSAFGSSDRLTERCATPICVGVSVLNDLFPPHTYLCRLDKRFDLEIAVSTPEGTTTLKGYKGRARRLSVR